MIVSTRRMTLLRTVGAIFLVIGLAGAGASPLLAQSTDGPDRESLDRLEIEIARIAEAAEGVVGVGATHLESGRSVYLNPDERFPMASTYKVPMAVAVLDRVDSGELTLDSLIAVEPEHLRGGTMGLFQFPGVELSVANLMEMMLRISDNTSTDRILDLAGGGEAVTSWLETRAIDGITVSRPTVEVIADYRGVAGVPPGGHITRERYRELASAVTETTRREAEKAFHLDPRDTSTPAGMVRLLEGIWRGELITRESSDLLLEIMYRCLTGAERIRGMLPEDTPVGNKTGTIGRITADVGFIDLPEEAGHVAVAVYVKDSDVPVPERERVIAHVSRAVYNYFLFNPAVEARD